MLTHTYERHLRNTCERHLISANDVHLVEWIGIQRCTIAYFDEGVWQREDEHPFGTESYPRRSRLVHSTSKLFIALAYQMICTFWYWFGALPKRASFGYGRTDDVNWYGVRELHKRAFEKYGHGRSTGTGTGVLYKWQRVFVRAFSENFTMTRTVHQSQAFNLVKYGNPKILFKRQRTFPRGRCLGVC